MKTFLITILFLTIFTNCSSNNAFSHFDMNDKQAKSEDSLQSSKIFDKDSNSGIVSAIYLNHVLPQKYNDKEYFYIYLYIKDNLKEVSFFLNDEEAYDVTSLKSKNDFSYLTSFQGDWQQYYLVEFEKQNQEVLNLQINASQSHSREMIFKKED